MLTEQLQPGERFEYFRIEAFVVRTCMTTIYRATDLQNRPARRHQNPAS